MKDFSCTVLTSITGGKDDLLENLAIKRTSKAKWIAYMDLPQLSPTWTVKPASKIFVDPRRNSRLPKILSHQYALTEYSIWIDGNIRLTMTPEDIIAKYLKDKDFAVFKHPNRDCVYDEAIKCAVKGLDDPEVIIEQAKMYEDSGYAKHKGLSECGILIRRHTPMVQEFNNAWWSEYCRHSRRDQISFPYALDRVGLPINQVPEYFVFDEETQLATRGGGIAELVFHKTHA